MIFSPSIDAVFGQTKLSIQEKLGILQQIGYKAFEIWGWWDRDLEELKRTKEELGLALASMCTRMVSLVIPEMRSQFILGLKESLDVASKLNCAFLICQTGDHNASIPREVQRQSLIAGLKEAVPYLEQAGVTLIVEPLNTKVDHPGYYLEHSEEAFAIIDEVNSPNVKIVYDIYHQQISEGNLIPTITSNIDKIAYFHMADHPGRHEAGTGEIHYPNVFAEIQKTGYTGYMGLEYFPLSEAGVSLNSFMQQFRHFQL